MKTQKGITLVALIITIIVLLIIAVVAIGAVRESKIIGHAQNAKERYKVEQIEENVKLAQSKMKLEESTKEITLKELLEKYGENLEPITIAENAKSIPENMPAGEYYILTPEKYASDNENTRKYAKLTSRGEERTEDILKNVYVINEQFEVYYVIEGTKGETKKISTDQKYLLFTHDESKGTSTFTGMNPEYLMDNGYYGEGDYVITDLVIPEKVINDSGVESTVTAINRYALKEVSTIKTLVIPKTVLSIAPWTFEDCTSLTKVTIPEGNMTLIAQFAFRNCTNLSEITIPKNVSSMQAYVFQGCPNLTIYVDKYEYECSSWPSGVWYGDAKEVIYNIPKNPDGVTEQKYLLFTHDEKTGTSTFTGMNPEYLMDNGYYGEGDYVITDLVIPAVVKNNKGEDSIVTTATSNNGPSSKNTTIKTVVLPETIQSIGPYTFYNWTAMKTINIPSKVTSIAAYAFQNCTSLTAITIPKGVTGLSGLVFSGCTSLTSVTFPEGFTRISSPVFQNCTSLTSVTFPEGFTSLSSPVFQNCTSLTSVYFPSSIDITSGGYFSGCSSELKVYVDKYEIDCWSWPSGWNGSATVIYKPQQELDQKYFTYELDTTNKTATITGINPDYGIGYEYGGGGRRFYYTAIKDGDNDPIVDIIIPNKIIEDGEEYTVTKIGTKAFDTGYGSWQIKNLVAFKTIVIPNTVTTIEFAAFANIPSATVYIPNSVTNMGQNILLCTSSGKIIINKTSAECSTWPSNWYNHGTVTYTK